MVDRRTILGRLLRRRPPSDLSEWLAAGFSPDAVPAWRLTGLIPLAAAAWSQAGVGPDVANRWIARGYTYSTAADWVSAGVNDPRAAAGWVRACGGPAGAAEWIQVGVTRHFLAQQCVARDITPTMVAEWFLDGDMNVRPPEWTTRHLRCVAAWLTSGVDRRSELWSSRQAYVEWLVPPPDAEGLRASGFTVDQLRSFEARGFSVGDTRTLWQHGATCDMLEQAVAVGLTGMEMTTPTSLGRGLDRVVAWRRVGRSIEDATAWIEDGFDESLALALTQAGVSIDDARQWRSFDPTGSVWPIVLAGIPRPFLVRCKRAGLQLDHLDALLNRGVTTATLEKWFDRGFWWDGIAAWWHVVDRDDPEAAIAFERSGISSADARTWLANGLTRQEIASWLPLRFGDPRRGHLKTALSSAAQINAWRATAIPVARWPAWIRVFGDRPDAARRWFMEGATAEELWANRERLGFDQIRTAHPADARPSLPSMRFQPVDEDGTIPSRQRETVTPPPPLPSSLALPRSSPPPPSTAVLTPGDFATWLHAGRNWFTSAGITKSTHRSFLESLYDSGFGWASRGERLFPWNVSDEWLEEVLARAESLQPQIRRAPEWPVMFRGRDLTVVLTVQDKWATAWVGANTQGVLVSFRTSDFELRTYSRDRAARAGVGLAISWYLDCCISLREATHPHLRRGSDSPALTPPSRATRSMISYVPTPTFDSYVDAVSTGARTPPLAHRVKGHLRSLAGRSPSAEARSHAPAHIRLNMGPNETFVRAHTRAGSGEAEAMRLHLTRHSSLADALGAAERTTR